MIVHVLTVVDDFLEIVGSLLVTYYCVMKGQPVLTAMSITLTATVIALVLNEIMEDVSAN